MPETNPLYTFYDQYNNLLNPEDLNNLQPIFHKPIDQHLGIQISGRFLTTDATANGDMSYITVARNPNLYAAHDGYGLAWRKQPEHLLQVATAQTSANPTSALTALSDDIKNKFFSDYNKTVFEALADAQSTGIDIKDNKAYLKYNVYLIDNDILKEEVWVSAEMIWDQTGGKNQFLQAAKCWIEPNIQYEYNLKIYDKLGLDAWIYPTNTQEIDPLSAENRTIWRGQTYPPYVAMARHWGTKDADKVAYFGGLAGGHFGIAVEDTHNAEWHYDNLQIKSFLETFPMHLFKFKPPITDFPSYGPLTVNYVGVGYDEALYAQDGNGHSFVRAWIWNTAENGWEIIGSHKYTKDDTRNLQQISNSFTPLSNYKDSQGFVNIVAHPANSGPPPGQTFNPESNKYEATTVYNPDTGQWEVVTDDFSNDSGHKLESYYASITNMNIEGTHKGNAVDVYVHDPENIQTGSITTTLDSDTLSTAGINGIHPYIQEFVELRQHISQTVLDPSTYSIVSDATGKAFSKDADFKIFFLQDNIIGSRIDLVYKYWTGGETVTSYLTNDANRVPGSDLLVKVMPPHFITVSNLEYSGGLPPITMREALSTKINSNTATRIDKSDVIKMLYDFGATYVNTSFVLTIEEVTPEFVSKPHTVSDTYEISEATVGRFFTSPQRLLGMTQQ